jgi:hypothetical protein
VGSSCQFERPHRVTGKMSGQTERQQTPADSEGTQMTFCFAESVWGFDATPLHARFLIEVKLGEV